MGASKDAMDEEGNAAADLGLVARIRESFDSLTATEREAAQFILGHLTDVLVCNSVELSQLSGISQPTLSRLYRKLGYSNAGEFRRDVRRIHRPGAPETVRNVRCDDLLADHLLRDSESLKHTFEDIDRAQLDSACRDMAMAPHVAVVGYRNGYPVALHLREQLLQLRGNIDILPHPGQSIAEELTDYSSDDVAVIVGVGRRPPFFARLVDVLLERGVTVVVIGDVAARNALIGRNVVFFNVALNSHMLSSFTAAFALVALFADEVGERLGSDDVDVRKRIEDINDCFERLASLVIDGIAAVGRNHGGENGNGGIVNKINGALAYDLPSTGPWAALVFLVSLNLRPSIAAVGPVLSQIGTGLHWAEGVQGVLTAIPLLAFAAISPLVTFLARRIGIDMSILLALLCIAAGDAIRSFGGGVGIWLGTVVFASAIAVGNVLVPVIAKRDYAGHVAMATGVYSGCITAGSATAGLLSAPLAQMWGGWRASLAFWSVPPLVVAALWALRILHNRKVVIASAGGTIETSDTGDIDDIGDRSTTANAQNPHSAQRPACSTQSSHGVFARVLRRPMTWYVTAFMGLQSSAFYTMSNWMPSISASIGYDDSTAGVHLFIFQGIGILSGLVIPKLMNVRGNQVCAALTASAPMLIAGLGMLLLPHLMPVWAFVGGCAQGASLVVALALIALRGRDSAETVVLSGVAQSFGYLIASLGPLMFGVLVQATGGHHVPLMVFTFVAFLQCVVAVIVGRPSKM